MKRTASHLASFVLGVVVGIIVASKACPPLPAPADSDPPPVTAPAAASEGPAK